jgi:malate dehydrogenase
MHVAIVGGGGTIGSTVAFALRHGRSDPDITLLDTDGDAARGHGIDIQHSGTHGDDATGAVHGGPVSVDALADADCVVVTASAPRQRGGDQRGGRETYLPENVPVAESVAEALRGIDPVPVLVVTNPLDWMVQRLSDLVGWDRSWFLGYALSETARTAHGLAARRDVPPASVEVPTVGQHGEHVVPVFSRATIDGQSVTVTDDERDDLVDYVREIPYDIVQMRGAADSSRWVTGAGVARTVETILDAREDVLCLSTPLDGEYGESDVALAVPVEVSDAGVTTIREWSLSEWERERFAEGADAVRATLAAHR